MYNASVGRCTCLESHITPIDFDPAQLDRVYQVTMITRDLAVVYS